MVTEFDEGPDGLVGGLPPVLVQVVDEDDVYAVQTGAVQGVLDGPQDAVPAVVPNSAHVVGDIETFVVPAGGVVVGTDWDNVGPMVWEQRVCADDAEAAAVAVLAGNDLIMTTPGFA